MPLKLEIKKKLISKSERVKCVDLHPELPWVLVSLYSGNITIYDYTTQATVKTIENSMAPVRTAKFIARKQWIVSGADDLQIRVFNYNTLEKVKAFDAHNDYIRKIVVHVEQPIIISSSDDSTIKIWNYDKNFALQKTLDDHIHYVMDLAFNPREVNTFCSASLDKTIKVWNINSAGTKANFTLTGHEQGVNTVAYHQGDKPYIISGGDDFVMKVWDYQTKQCVHTLEGHQQNISCVVVHPEIPIIISSSEDGSLKLWNSSTFKLESSLNYNLDRAWSIDLGKENPNIMAIGYDEGTVVVKLGSDEPISSLNNGKILWAKNMEIRGANLKAVNVKDSDAVKDGENININVKELGQVDFQPIGIKHAPNGHSFAVFSDSEYMIYRSQTFKQSGFGQGTDVAFAPNGDFAVRDSYTIRILKGANNEEHCKLKTDYYIEGLVGGPLLIAKSSEFLIFYDWESAQVIRRIDVAAKKIYWNDAKDQVAITTSEDIFILKFEKDTLAELLAVGEENPEGYEEAFDLVHEVHDTAVSGLWINNVFYYTTNSGKINYTIMGKTFNFNHTDKKKYLIGFLPQQNKVYLTDKQCNIVCFELDAGIPQYLSEIQANNIEKSRDLLPKIPEIYYDKLAKFLDIVDLKTEAFSIVKNQEHKFELALTLQDINSAFEIAQNTQNSNQYKQVGDVALFNGKIQLATECFEASNDFGSQLMIYSSLGLKEKLQDLAKASQEHTRMNVAFAAYFLLNDLDNCLEVLIKSNRFSEAAIFAKSYIPSKISYCVDLWKQDLEKNNQILTAQKIANPMDYIEDESYGDLQLLLKLEEFYKEKLEGNEVPAHQYSEYQELISQDIFSQIKEDLNLDLESINFQPANLVSENALLKNHLQEQQVQSGEIEE